MTLEIIRTSDGSDTIFHHELNQHYHSTFGAVQESRHIFIASGLITVIGNIPYNPDADCLNILEIGFGTGLNALLTLAEAETRGIKVHYVAVEASPLEESYWSALNYPRLFGSVDYTQVFSKLHHAAWNMPEAISPFFTLHKIQGTLEDYVPPDIAFNLVYFDAFGPDVQPSLWTENIFRRLFNGLSRGGILVTYSVKGTIRRAMCSAGFTTEKLPGPPGKRHILRATKT